MWRTEEELSPFESGSSQGFIPRVVLGYFFLPCLLIRDPNPDSDFSEDALWHCLQAIVKKKKNTT